MSKELMATTESYLSFRLGKEAFAVSVSKVLEILEVPQITKVPQCPEYMRGVINLRGNVLPVIDTRIKFGMPATEDTISTCITVLQVEVDGESLTVGALVDAVQEVLEIAETQIQAPPTLGSRYKSNLISGMVKFNEQFIMLLNIDEVFNSNELLLLQDSSAM